MTSMLRVYSCVYAMVD